MNEILFKPETPFEIYHCESQEDYLKDVLDHEFVKEAKAAIENAEPIVIEHDVVNINRTLGTILGSEVTRKWQADGLPDKTIKLKLKGPAGQSAGAFLPKGIEMSVCGAVNDYFGKGLSGGKIAVFPPETVGFDRLSNTICGNVTLYGATSGEAYIAGEAGMRFAVRNSGVHTVVEGIGDHGCEYMTGGSVVVIGTTGKNFAAGMSGGVAYVLKHPEFEDNLNGEMVDLDPMENSDVEFVTGLIKKHHENTQSPKAAEYLKKVKDFKKLFYKVMPRDYKRVLSQQQEEKKIS